MNYLQIHYYRGNVSSTNNAFFCIHENRLHA